MTPLAVLLVALVAEDPTTLRGAPDDAAPAQATLYRGDWLEVRGEVPGFFKVWDHRHERPGYVRAARVRVHKLEEASAPELHAIVRFLRDASGAESLGIGYAALYLRASSPQRGQAEWGEVLRALGTMADRLARRAGGTSSPDAPVRASDSVLVGQLGVIESYGVRLRRFEQLPAARGPAAIARPPRTIVCYDGDAFARVMAMTGALAADRAAAALALTRPGCLDPSTPVAERRVWNDARLTILGEADPSRPAFAQLSPALAHPLRLRTAEALTERAHAAAASGDLAPAVVSTAQARRLLALVDRGQLAPEDQAFYEETAVRVAALRALVESDGAAPVTARRGIAVEITGGRPGESCVRLWPATRKPADRTLPLIQRCSFGVILPGSVRIADSGRAVAVAVSPLPAWTEQWIFRGGDGPDAAAWRADVIPPALGQPGDDIGYVEVAGFAPDGRQVLVVRDFVLAGRAGRRFEQLGPDGAVLHWSPTPQRLTAFSRWASPSWRLHTLSLR